MRKNGSVAKNAEFEERLKRIEMGVKGKKVRLGRISLRVLLILIGLNAAMVLAPPFRYPVQGVVTSVFFFRQKPDAGSRLVIEMHRGLDIAAPPMTEVNASAAGIVSQTGFDGELGNFIRIRHLFGVETVYGHLARISVRKGQLIMLPALSTIGNVGSTGRSTGPHLHFQITIGGTPVPPRFLLFYHGLRKLILGF